MKTLAIIAVALLAASPALAQSNSVYAPRSYQPPQAQYFVYTPPPPPLPQAQAWQQYQPGHQQPQMQTRNCQVVGRFVTCY
jgi:hypothetical protein